MAALASPNNKSLHIQHRKFMYGLDIKSPR